MDSFKNLKILYIDDEKTIRDNAVEYLSFYCNSVYEAIDGIDGLKKYQKYMPDIIITDIKMPKLNGIELVKEIRKKDKKTKIIIATAFLETSYLLQAVELGLIKYIIKPVTADKLLPILNLCIEDVMEDNNIFNITDNFIFDTLNKTLFHNKKQIFLAKKELLFLDILIKNYKRTVKYEELNNYVWQGEMSDDAIRSVVKDLRKKISKQTVKNISGIGYQIYVKP